MAMLKVPELVSPGGSFEKIKYAFIFGADAVYAGLAEFSLRSRENRCDKESLIKAAALARSLRKKFYLTFNIYAHERHIKQFKQNLSFIEKVAPDAVIISDPGFLELLRKNFKRLKIHLSTQANATNSEAVKFWASNGVSRVILAREVTLEEIRAIRRRNPEVELEIFVHGAMCMSYSGRCLLSRFLLNRSANLGDCAQPCRWKWSTKEERVIGDEKANKNSSPYGGKNFLLEEDEHGTYFINSKDLCLIEYLKELRDAGVDAFKIEGRNKSVYYLSLTTRAYRRVIDGMNYKPFSAALFAKISKREKKNLKMLSGRGLSSGFLFGKERWKVNTKQSLVAGNYQFVGEILALKENEAQVNVHNRILKGETLKAISPKRDYLLKVKRILNKSGLEKDSAHGGVDSIYKIVFSQKPLKYSLLVKKDNTASK